MIFATLTSNEENISSNAAKTLKQYMGITFIYKIVLTITHIMQIVYQFDVVIVTDNFTLQNLIIIFSVSNRLL